MDECIKRTKKMRVSGNIAAATFVERMIKDKFRVERWHYEYIGEAFGFKPAWASFKYNELLEVHK